MQKGNIYFNWLASNFKLIKNINYRQIFRDYTYFHGGEILEVYDKDSNGQAASPINEKIKGIFVNKVLIYD